MSIIGTRPPLLSETSLYELHHRAIVLNHRNSVKRDKENRRNNFIDYKVNFAPLVLLS